MIQAFTLLTAGGGQIGPTLYAQDVDVLSVLSGYLASGYANAAAAGIAADDADDIAIAWAYYQFYNTLAELMAVRPASMDLKDSASQSWTAAQFQYIANRASSWFTAYTEALEAATPEDEDTEGWATIASLRSL